MRIYNIKLGHTISESKKTCMFFSPHWDLANEMCMHKYKQMFTWVQYDMKERELEILSERG